jgi:hypothetical protein
MKDQACRKMGVWVITKIVFWGRRKSEVFEKSSNDCEYGAELGFGGAKNVKMENVVKRTVRYLFLEDLWENRR